MVSDLDIYRSARLLIERHGEDAPIEAAMNADKFLAAGDLDGAATWQRIVRATKDLLSKERPPEATVQ